MAPQKNNSRRLVSYDFFRGVIVVGLIFFTTLFYLFPGQANIEFFYRWALLGFLFFSGLVIGESVFERKKRIYFFQRGIQILALFLGINIALLFPSGGNFLEFSSAVITGDYDLILPLLLPLGIFFLLLPLVSLLPSFLGLSWTLLLFFLLDVLALQKGFLSLNAFFLTMGYIGFFLGRVLSLDDLRKRWSGSFSVLPFLCLYVALAILVIGSLDTEKLFSVLSFFWSFHFLLVLLFYFSIPSTLFCSEPNVPKPALRRFLEPMGVDALFLYVFVSLGFEIVTRILPDFFVSSIVHTLLLGVHITILCFAIITLLQQSFRKNRKLKKCFRFFF